MQPWLLNKQPITLYRRHAIEVSLTTTHLLGVERVMECVCHGGPREHRAPFSSLATLLMLLTNI